MNNKSVKREYAFEPKAEYSNLNEHPELKAVLDKLNECSNASFYSGVNNLYKIRTFQVDGQKATLAEFHWWLRQKCGFPNRTKEVRDFVEKYFQQYDVKIHKREIQPIQHVFF
jgi:hypothetical protein